jgi:hypothetical protein
MMLLHCNRSTLAPATGFGHGNNRVVLGISMCGGRVCALVPHPDSFWTAFNDWAIGHTLPQAVGPVSRFWHRQAISTCCGLLAGLHSFITPTDPSQMVGTIRCHPHVACYRQSGNCLGRSICASPFRGISPRTTAHSPTIRYDSAARQLLG